MHLAVKTIIEQEKRLLLPTCDVIRYPDDCQSELKWESEGFVAPPYRYTTLVSNYRSWIERFGAGLATVPESPQMAEFDQVLVEQWEGDLRPDLIGIKGDRRLYIEVAVTHRIDAKKLNRIRTRQTAAIEILVPRTATSWDELRELVLNQSNGKQWAFSPRAESIAEADYQDKEPIRKARRDAEAKRSADAARRAQEVQAWRDERKRREVETAAQFAEKQELAAKIQAAEAKLAAERAAEFRKVQAAARAATIKWEAEQAAERQKSEAEEEAKQRLLDAEEAVRRETAIVALREGHPSPNLPLNGFVLFLDLDSALQPKERGFIDRLRCIADALRDTLCDIVVTSEIRHDHSAYEIAQLLTPLGGRHVGVTPILDPSDPYGNRAKEIESWEKANPGIRSVVIDGSSGGFGNRHVLDVSIRTGLTDWDADELRQYLRKNRRSL
ncbi:HAD domain-containing protein [Ferribacterium limneticum]|uniref:HAD domain-containing protein n=1 Tax=Ferribacterium limneticum TaxID=76259 RepID=UPI001CF9C478|nr:HAD domain-containing protein [Ferribacterium limneticum]UCV19534.1 hypothetical protein KI610_02825 [Ferribacterium limneticum]